MKTQVCVNVAESTLEFNLSMFITFKCHSYSLTVRRDNSEEGRYLTGAALQMSTLRS